MVLVLMQFFFNLHRLRVSYPEPCPASVLQQKFGKGLEIYFSVFIYAISRFIVATGRLISLSSLFGSYLVPVLRIVYITLKILQAITISDIAKKIIEKEGEYVLALKGNQETLLEDVSLYLNNEIIPQEKKVLQERGLYERTIEKGHGRIETRECYITSDISWLEGAERWEGLKGIGVIVSKREETGKEPTISRNYFIFSMTDVEASDLLRIKREHWAVENNLHWLLDVVFREDDARARTENAAENLNILRKQALQMMKRETTVKGSMRAKRLRCSYDIFYAFKVIGVK
jgi:predicted transposase YbfD/YdcC